MANIRNQCTWVHKDKAVATAKAKDLVAMSVARANRLEPLKTNAVDVQHSVLVVGGGVAGMTAAKSLADQGFHAILVEKSGELGGGSRAIKDPRVAQFLQTLIGEVSSHPDIEVFTDAEIASVNGFIGNFETEVRTGSETRTLSHGAAILATGGQAADTDEYGYNKNPRVTRWHDLWDHPDIDSADSVVFIQCVGSRDENRPYCSKVCCTASIENAIRLRKSNPDRSVYILYRDIRTYGDKERLYQKARKIGVIFIRYALERKPVVTETDRGAEVVVHDYILGRDVSIAADIVNLATAIEPADNAELARMFKVSTNAERFLIEAHAKLRPVESATDGVYICGLAHYPKFMEESIAQAQAAASRATTVLSRQHIDIEPIVSTVDEALCIGCGLCEMACPFSAIELVKVEGKGYRARNIPALCKGCGICASSCPQKAIDMKHFRDVQIEAAISACA
jgi:heterodisulfide reductase subunit A